MTESEIEEAKKAIDNMSHGIGWKRFNSRSKIQVCHLCDTPICCNPKHLFLGTQKDNIKDCIDKNRFIHKGLRGELNPVSKLTESDVIKIYSTDESQRTLASKFGISQVQVGHIKRGVQWQYLIKEL